MNYKCFGNLWVPRITDEYYQLHSVQDTDRQLQVPNSSLKTIKAMARGKIFLPLPIAAALGNLHFVWSLLKVICGGVFVCSVPLEVSVTWEAI